MSKHTLGEEVEVKLALSPEGYQKLCAFLDKHAKAVGSEDQRNFYFDTPEGEFESKKEVLRLRLDGTKAVLTHKAKSHFRDGAMHSREEEWELSGFPVSCSGNENEVYDALLGYYQSQKSVPSVVREDLKCTGMMKNRRLKYQWNGFLLELDQTQLTSSYIDYELECETTDVKLFNHQIANLARELGFKLVEQSKSKYRRFLEVRRQQN